MLLMNSSVGLTIDYSRTCPFQADLSEIRLDQCVLNLKFSFQIPFALSKSNTHGSMCLALP